MQELMVSHIEDMNFRTNEASENLDQNVARFEDILTSLDEAMQQIADGKNAKEKFRAAESV